MLRKATESDRNQILDYCSEEPSINLFIIGDIELYGFDKDFQEVWVQTADVAEDIEKEIKEEIKEETPIELTGVVLRYHQNFIIYGKEKIAMEEIVNLMSAYPVSIISGKSSVILKLYPFVETKFEPRALNFAELSSDAWLVQSSEDVQVADVNDAVAIATAFDFIPEFEMLYPGGFEERLKQISNRISSGEGTHMFIRKDGVVISHGNTAAENSVSAMIGGVMTIEGYRRQHYSSIVVSALCKRLLDQGKRACLFYSGEACTNLFHKLGFKETDQWLILGGRKNE